MTKQVIFKSKDGVEYIINVSLSDTEKQMFEKLSKVVQKKYNHLSFKEFMQLFPTVENKTNE
jgi:malate/lactate dehydrogenase